MYSATKKLHSFLSITESVSDRLSSGPSPAEINRTDTKTWYLCLEPLSVKRLNKVFC